MYQLVLSLGVLDYLYEEEKVPAILTAPSIFLPLRAELAAIRADWHSYTDILAFLQREREEEAGLRAFLDDVEASPTLSD